VLISFLVVIVARLLQRNLLTAGAPCRKVDLIVGIARPGVADAFELIDSVDSSDLTDSG
jgi:hypothetical protein